MNISAKGMALLMHIERIRLFPYSDATGARVFSWSHVATIGYGHLIRENEWAKYKAGISAEEARALFQKDLIIYESAVNTVVRRPVLQHEFDALCILAFNIGLRAFRTSSVVKMLNGQPSRYKTLEAAWKAWNMDGGKESRGLNNRRAAEWVVFTTADYRGW